MEVASRRLTKALPRNLIINNISEQDIFCCNDDVENSQDISCMELSSIYLPIKSHCLVCIQGCWFTCSFGFKSTWMGPYGVRAQL